MNDKIKIVAVIPARLNSQRLPKKMLLDINGKPLVYYTYINAIKGKFDYVVVAVDDNLLYQKLKELNCNVLMTSKKHKSGTDRIGEVAKKIQADYYINIQGDEPLINLKILNRMIGAIKKDKSIEIITIGKKITETKEINDPNNVKIVCNKLNQALYFSRAVIPYNRNSIPKVAYIKHFGIYGYRADILKKIIKIKRTTLEQIEKLEQLRFLENGFKIQVIFSQYNSIGVDTKDDFEKVKKILKA